MRDAESICISGLWVVTLFHVLSAIVVLPFVALAHIDDRQHRLVSIIAGGHGLGLGHAGDLAFAKCQFFVYHVYVICITEAGWHFDVVRGAGCGIVILVLLCRRL